MLKPILALLDSAEIYTCKLIAHHRGALEMSKIALAEIKESETRKTAQKVIAAQTREIADLQSWLKRHGKSPQN